MKFLDSNKKRFGAVLYFLQDTFFYRTITSRFSNFISIVNIPHEQIFSELEKIYKITIDPYDSVPNYTTWYFIAKFINKTVGFVELVKKPKKETPYDGYWIHGLFVSHLFRRIGVGEQLILEVLKTAKLESADKIYLRVKKNNKGAIRLYKKHYFTEETNLLKFKGKKEIEQIIMFNKIDEHPIQRN